MNTTDVTINNLHKQIDYWKNKAANLEKELHDLYNIHQKDIKEQTATNINWAVSVLTLLINKEEHK